MHVKIKNKKHQLSTVWDNYLRFPTSTRTRRGMKTPRDISDTSLQY